MMSKKLNVDKKQLVKYAVPIWQRDKQIQYAISKIKERVQPNENKIEDPIAVVGYGPSLKYTWEKIKEFKYIITCSGAHRFLIDREIIPTYHLEVDPRDHKIKLLGEPHKDVEYLIASTCHPRYFDHLEGYNLKLWHIFDSTDEGISMLPPGEWGITGGCDAGLRAITMSGFLGFRNLHIFGLDGNFEGKKRHADYHPNNLYSLETEFNGKIYHTTPGMLEASRQSMRELDMIPAVKATFYGEGLTQDMYKEHIKKERVASKFDNIIGFQKPHLITSEYAELNKQLHEQNAVYGVGGGKYADTVIKLTETLNTKLILDYGCGKGHLAKSLPFPIWEYDPGVPGKESTPRPADIVMCTDVLEHIEPEFIQDVLSDLRRCVKMMGYFVIHTGPASKTLPDGRNTHLLQKTRIWWHSILKEYFEIGKITEVGPELHIIVGPKQKYKSKEDMKNKIYIGYDPREKLAYDIAEYSIKKYTLNLDKLDIEPLKLSEIKDVFNRPIEWRGNQMWCPISNAPQTTEFSTSRFAIPFLTKGWALFVDSDIIALGDVNELFEQADDRYAVMVVKHQQKVGENEIKMVDQASVYYNRKNWSSVMLINCDHPANKNLTLYHLNTWPGRDLHAFKWLKDEEIGELDPKWNHLVDITDPSLIDDANILHYTLGGPWIEGWKEKESDIRWNEILEEFKSI